VREVERARPLGRALMRYGRSTRRRLETRGEPTIEPAWRRKPRGNCCAAKRPACAGAIGVTAVTACRSFYSELSQERPAEVPKRSQGSVPTRGGYETLVSPRCRRLVARSDTHQLRGPTETPLLPIQAELTGVFETVPPSSRSFPIFRWKISRKAAWPIATPWVSGAAGRHQRQRLLPSGRNRSRRALQLRAAGGGRRDRARGARLRRRCLENNRRRNFADAFVIEFTGGNVTACGHGPGRVLPR